MNDKLKACPFCGKQPEEAFAWVNLRDTNESKQVGWYCLDCFEISLDNCAVSHLECDRWNSRPIESSLESRLKIAVEALENLQSFCGDIGNRYRADQIEEALAKIRGER